MYIFLLLLYINLPYIYQAKHTVGDCNSMQGKLCIDINVESSPSLMSINRVRNAINTEIQEVCKAIFLI